tara:strand:- start:3005 stop:5482 length:2478 start_codon:yes stop_codon:yes gene_type:complete
MKSFQVRQAFIDFFKSKGHHEVVAAPVVPTNDPTLLFTNAGMNQFKPYFLGDEVPQSKRLVNSQPCIRVSGKHNDLEEVGIDTYHHTSFEMLGNWSFGDYYKKEAIMWAWELLTEVYQLPKNHLLATVYDDDDEAAELWRTCTDIHPEHIVRCGKKDNFWEMGATGPCGPCSEIHLDLTPDKGLPIERDLSTGGLSTRYMELWNLVFIQYDRQSDESLHPLPDRHIDTGAGLERLTAQLQGVTSNYDTDCFQTLIKHVGNELGMPYDQGEGGVPHRVISDHIRTVAFGISDNVLPSNEGRGYVLRRLIRRALRFASQAGKNEPFLHRLIPVVHDSLGGHYENIDKRSVYISELIKAEEVQFLRTVSSGLTLFKQELDKMNAAKEATMSGQVAFKLYDTYGFPLDLTQVMAKESHISVDEKGFEAALNAQRERSRAARSETLNDGKDETLEVIGSFIGEVQHGVYVDQPGGGEARIPVNDAQRFAMAQHHTGTHLLHEGLRKVLGPQVQQAGSLVDVNRLRFDFSYGKAITEEELDKISSFVNDCIRDAHIVTITEAPIDEAKARGAHAMFGEKYGDTVRVVDISNISIELCGGNHVRTTKDLQVFKIISESAIAAGTRRIEALVGDERVERYNEERRALAYKEYRKRWLALSEKLAQPNVPNPLEDTASMAEILEAQDVLIAVSKAAEKALRQSQKSTAGALFDDIIKSPIPLRSGYGVGVFHVLADQPVPVLRELADRAVNALGDCLVVLGSSINDKGHAIAKVSPSVMGSITAKELIDELTAITGGGGGGRDNMAQAGGLGTQKLDEAMAHMLEKYAQTSTGD